MIRLWLKVTGKDPTCLMSPSPSLLIRNCMMSIDITGVNLVHLLKVVSARILPYKVTIFLFMTAKYFGEIV